MTSVLYEENTLLRKLLNLSVLFCVFITKTVESAKLFFGAQVSIETEAKLWALMLN